MRPGAILTVEQRFLRGPNLWSGQACLVSLVDMGPLAHALSTDVPGLDAQLLSLFPGLHGFAGALARGAYLAEVLGQVALELQRIAGLPPGASCATLVHGRRALARIIIAGQLEALAVQAFALATDIVLALCAGKAVALRPHMAALVRTVRAAAALPPLAAAQTQHIAAVADDLQRVRLVETHHRAAAPPHENPRIQAFFQPAERNPVQDAAACRV